MQTIKLVYQDCVLCGSKKDWGEKQLQDAYNAGFNVEKMSFTQFGASELIWEATRAGMHLPFFTDGTIFAQTVAEYIEKKTGQGEINAVEAVEPTETVENTTEEAETPKKASKKARKAK